MKKLHLTTQAKGGVGKSFITAIYSQYLRQKYGDELRGIFDVDAQNSTLTQFKGLSAIGLELREHNKILPHKFDQFMEAILTPTTGAIVADVGSGTLMPLMGYMHENRAFEMLRDSGVEIVMHVPLAGSQMLEDTLRGLLDIATQVGNAGTLIVWTNPFWGRIGSGDKKRFEDMEAYKKIKDKLDAIIEIPETNPDLLGRDINHMMGSKLTFAEVMESDKFPFMEKQRIKNFRDVIWGQLEAINL